MSFFLKPKSFQQYLKLAHNMEKTHASIENIINLDIAGKERSFTYNHESDLEPESTSKPTSKRGGKQPGTCNYTSVDTSVLLDLVEEHEPTGNNGWARVCHDYNLYAKENDRPWRRQDNLKTKYDKMLYVRKQTGDPTCPPHVRRAKNMQKEILSKMFSLTYNSNLDEDVPDNVVGNGASNKKSSNIVGSTVRKPNDQPNMHSSNSRKRPLLNPRAPFSKRLELDLVEGMNQMTRSMADLADAQLRREKKEIVLHDEIKEMVSLAVEKTAARIEAEISSSITKTLYRLLGRNSGKETVEKDADIQRN